jgi:hypothetical protein
MNSTREQQMHAVQSEALELFSRKNKDYGDAFADYGPIGVIVRMGDKIRRLQNITNNSVAFVSDEGIRDTLIDLHNYAAMAVMLMDEQYTKDGLSTPSPTPIYLPTPNSSPVTSSPVTSSPVTSSPVATFPVTSSPVAHDCATKATASFPVTSTSTPSPPRLMYRQLTEKW